MLFGQTSLKLNNLHTRRKDVFSITQVEHYRYKKYFAAAEPDQL